MASLDMLEMYRFEQVRLASFRYWPLISICPKKLAKAGFYYQQGSRTTTCFDCLISIKTWNEGEKPKAKHLQANPSCRFIIGSITGNVPLGADPRKTPVIVTWKENVDTPVNDLGRYNDHGGPVQIFHETFVRRLHSFSFWPKAYDTLLNPTRLAEAGFLYIGEGDRVMCFHCGGRLHKFQKGDDPWKLHIKYFPQCRYLAITRYNPPTALLDTWATGPPLPPSPPIYDHPPRNTSTPDPPRRTSSLPTTEIFSPKPILADIRLGPRLDTRALAPAEPTAKRNNERKPHAALTDKTNKTSRHPNEKHRCRICSRSMVDTILLPCLHANFCSTCVEGRSECGVCSKKVDFTIKFTPLGD